MSLPGLLRAGQDRGVPVEREGSLLASFCADREKGSEAVTVAMVWPCPLAVDAYAAPAVTSGSPARPARRVPGRWCSGRILSGLYPGRAAAEDLYVPGCGARRAGRTIAAASIAGLAAGYSSHQLGARREVASGDRGPPGSGKGAVSYLTSPRLGAPLRQAPGTRGGVRGAGGGAGRSTGRAAGRGGPVRADRDRRRVHRAAEPAGWHRLGAWRFTSAVTGGRLIAANTVSPWYVVGRRRFMPPIPP